MYQTYYQTRGLPGANAAGARHANTKEVVVVDSPTDSDGDQPQGDHKKSKVGLCARH